MSSFVSYALSALAGVILAYVTTRLAGNFIINTSHPDQEQKILWLNGSVAMGLICSLVSILCVAFSFEGDAATAIVLLLFGGQVWPAFLILVNLLRLLAMWANPYIDSVKIVVVVEHARTTKETGSP